MTLLLLVFFLVVLPAFFGFFFNGHSSSSRKSVVANFGLGAPIVYQKQEVTTHPSADARDVRPAARGEFYYYTVLTYLRVTDVLSDGRLVGVARNHRLLEFEPNDSNLRKASFFERLLYCPRLRHP